MLKGKTVAVCVSGGIAAYKACDIVSRLVKLRASVHVVMTQSAKEFIAPLTFETLSNNKVISEMFRPDREWEAEHISLAKKADLFLIAPATANVIGKLANGIADDFLSTTVMAARFPVVLAPAMNTAMLTNPAYVNNEIVLKERGFVFVDSSSGRLACGDSGKGRLADVDDIIAAVVNILKPKRDFAQKRVLVTLGATREYIDPVRFISNESSGKMGLALINALTERGADVTAVAGFVSVDLSGANCDVVRVKTADEMMLSVDALMSKTQFDYMIFSAAVADYRVAIPESNKIKSQELTLKLIKNPDIAYTVGQRKATAVSAASVVDIPNVVENVKVSQNAKNAENKDAVKIFKDAKTLSGGDLPANIQPAKNSESVKTPQNVESIATLQSTKTSQGGKNFKTVVFSAETENLIENARKKMEKKNADMVVANDVTLDGAGFNVDTNIAVIITSSGQTELKKMPKTDLAHIILDKLAELGNLTKDNLIKSEKAAESENNSESGKVVKSEKLSEQKKPIG